MTTEFWIQMIIYAATLGTSVGTILMKLRYMEKKIDVHNKVVDRMYRAESRLNVIDEHLGIDSK